MKKKVTLLLIFAGFSLLSFSQKMSVYSDFPGGNIIIDKIKGDSIWLRPDLRDTRGEWFYWYFAVSNAKGRTLTFLFNYPDQFSRMGVSISTDDGRNWHWQGGDAVNTNSFSYTFTGNDEVQFSMGIPYTQKDFNSFISKYKEHPNVKLSFLTKTKKGRMAEMVYVKKPDSEPLFKVLITARHHACEMIASYTMEGIIEEVVQNPWLMDHVEFLFVPFMDKDGVEDGDQGKNRLPRDHNRDYSQVSVHETVAAMRTYIPVWSEKKLVLGLDLHCPWIKDGNNEYIFLIGSFDEEMTRKQLVFSDILEKNNNSELKYYSKNFVRRGDFDWTLRQYPDPGTSFPLWMETFEEVNLSTTLEIPYSYSSGQVISEENSRAFGRDVGKAIEEYLRGL